MSEASQLSRVIGQRHLSRIPAVSIVSKARLTSEALAAFLTSSIRLQVVEVVQALAEVSSPADGYVVLVDAASIRIDEIPQEAGRFRLLIYGLEDRDHALLLAWAAVGAAVFVSRDATPDDLLVGLHAVAEGSVLCPRTIVGAVMNQASNPRSPAMTLEYLTRRERQILTLIDQGLSNKEIASRLSIRVSTVKNHVHSILNRLGVSTRRDATLMAAPAVSIVSPTVPHGPE